MKINTYISQNKTLLLDVCFALLVVLVSFPKFEPDFNIGLDATFRWAYNYLFAYDYDALLSLRYTYGPLAFLKVPVAVGNNFIIAITVFTILKTWFCFLLFRLGKTNAGYFSYLVVLVVAYFTTIDQAIIGIVALYGFRYFNASRLLHFILIVGISLLGFYIKPQIGINCFAILAMLIILTSIRKFNTKLLIQLIGISLLLIFSSSLLIGHSILYFFELFYSSLKISSGYSSSLSLFPENNWFLLSVFILCTLSTPFLVKKKNIHVAFLLLPVFFFTWKYGMVREEFLYYKRMIDTIIVCWGLLILASNFRSYFFYLTPALSILVLFLNLDTINTEGKEYHKSWFGVNHFAAVFFDHVVLEEKSIQLSAKNIHVNRLPEHIRKEIGPNSIDFYPWDMSFAPANQLNWQPRKPFQSLGISSWSDQHYLGSFSLENGPIYVLFHFVNDSMGGQLGGIDYRYILNAEPLTNNALLCNYDIIHSTDNWALFEQQLEPNLHSPEPLKAETIRWNQWYKCPNEPDGLLKLNTKIKSTVFGGLMKIVYKSTEYIVDYQLENDEIKSYRFIPSNAQNGLWVSPFLNNFDSNQIPLKTKRIRFRVKDASYTEDHFEATWEIQKPTKSNSHYFLR